MSTINIRYIGREHEAHLYFFGIDRIFHGAGATADIPAEKWPEVKALVGHIFVETGSDDDPLNLEDESQEEEQATADENHADGESTEADERKALRAEYFERTGTHAARNATVEKLRSLLLDLEKSDDSLGPDA